MKKETKIAENDKTEFYTNMMTKDFKDGYKIILAKQKLNGKKEYLLLKEEKPVFASQQIENIWAKHDMLKKINKL
jgi:hypothetical protein